MDKNNYRYDEDCRNQIYDGTRYLITEVGVSEQDKKRLNVNCKGFGRVRNFMRKKDEDPSDQRKNWGDVETAISRAHDF